MLSNLNRSHSSEPNTEADEDNPPQILTEAKVTIKCWSTISNRNSSNTIDFKVDPDQKHVKYDKATRASLRHRIVKNLSFGKTKNKPSKVRFEMFKIHL